MLIATGEAVLTIGAACGTRLSCPGPATDRSNRGGSRNVALLAPFTEADWIIPINTPCQRYTFHMSV